MRLLILGGTVFVGRHVTAEALRRGHTVTLFNRGRSDPDGIAGTTLVRGDRDGGLDALRDVQVDAAIDTSGYVPRVVRASAELLRDRTSLYLFVSSVSAYGELTSPPDEDAPLAPLADETVEEVAAETYGPLKALCEQAVQEVLGERACIVRPGVIAGPDDPTDRYTYWVRRLAAGGEMLAPGRPDQLTQVIDVRDLAAFLVDLCEQRRGGVYNAASQPLAFGALLDGSAHGIDADARLVWVGEEFLRDHAVEPWSELPLWLPGSDAEGAYLLSARTDRARAAGLRNRALADTARDTLAWWREHGPSDRQAGLSPERERELLDAWHARRRELG